MVESLSELSKVQDWLAKLNLSHYQDAAAYLKTAIAGSSITLECSQIQLCSSKLIGLK